MYVLTYDGHIPPAEKARIQTHWSGIMKHWRKTGEEPLLVLDRGVHLDVVNPHAVGWHCWYCGTVNGVAATKCNGCNANIRVA
jgi:hypothetical protein